MELLKNKYFQRDFIKKLSFSIKQHYTEFDNDRFEEILLSTEFNQLELKEKLRRCAQVMNETIVLKYENQIDLLMKIAKDFDDFNAMVFAEFVGIYGIEHKNLSMSSLAYFTRFGSGEFAIRHYLNIYKDEALDFLYSISSDTEENVRRFSSEGCRPLLPWAKSVPYLKEKRALEKIILILENLKDDKSEFVRKSVANNINDISKIDEQLALNIAKKWIGHSKNRDRIVKHGLRTLLKKGNKEALALFGCANSDYVTARNLQLSKNNIKLGETITFSVAIETEKPKNIRAEYSIHYVKSNGSLSKKTFKICEKDFKLGIHKLERKISFKDLSTRKHYTGKHKIEIIINGDIKAEQIFWLVK